jgi:hypothetical protein
MTNRITPLDGFVLVAALGFSLGCITTAHRPARTIDAGQVSVSGSYLRALPSGEGGEDVDPIQLAAIDMRVGIARGVDAGIAHTWDFTQVNDGAYKTFWGDVKVQLTNRDNLLRRPTLSTGLIKGYLYDTGDAEGIHITSVPLTLDYRVSESLTPFLFYRYELVRDNFIPSGVGSDIRHTFGIGAEIELAPGRTTGWSPKLGLAIGRFNSLDGGDGRGGTILNAGLTLTSPGRPRD